MSHHVSWFAGIDLGDHKHRVHLTDAAGTFVGAAAFPHRGRGIAQLLGWLLDKAGADPGSIGVALEVPHGAVVDGLLEQGFATFAINPKQADRGRELLVLSGAKDDPRDAEGLAVMLRVVPRVFRHLQPKHPVLVLLRDRSRLRADLVKRRTQLSQKIRAQLLRYFPAMWELAGSLSGLWGSLFLTLWERAPTPERARRLHRGTVAKVLGRCKIRKRTAEEVVGVLRQPALVVAPGVTQGAVETIGMLVAQLRLVHEQVKAMDRGIAELLEELPAALGEAGDGADSLTRLLSMKGAGPVVAAGLFGEASDLLVGGTFGQTRAYLGAAPVTRESGGTKRRYKRRAVNRYGQNALYHFSAAAIAADPGFQRQKEVLKARGHNHARILRTLGDRILRIFFAMQRDRTLYDPERTLRKVAA
ncbi:MAG: IS110 family transposase [Acidobacteriota bacterium]|nr:IS110 family transposase [Acidobacteriota bacterium]